MQRRDGPLHTVLTQPRTEHASRVDCQEVPHSRYTTTYLPVFRIWIHWFRIRIQHFRLNTNPDPGFWWPIIEKKIYGQKFLSYFFWSKIAIYLSLGLHKGRPCYRRSIQSFKREHPTLQNMKFLDFFPIFVGNFFPPGSGSTDLIESRSNPDPDPKHRYLHTVLHSLFALRSFGVLITGSSLCRWFRFAQLAKGKKFRP